MVHHSLKGFVVAVSHQGKILREHQGTVYLPFDSEYSLLIKNPTYKRVGVSVTIDGTDVLGGRKVIINSRSSSVLERMVLDGNLESGPALKFVRVDHPDVQDPSSTENGNIAVSFYEEIVTPLQRPDPFIKYKGASNEGPMPWRSTPEVLSHSIGMPKSVFTNNVSCNIGSSPITSPVVSSFSEPGATVPGNTVGQAFCETSVSLESTPSATVSLKLRGRSNPVFTEDTRQIHCPTCGVRQKWNNKFCSNCGQSLEAIREALVRS